MKKKLVIVLLLGFVVQTLFTFPVQAAAQVDILSDSGFTDILGYYHVVGEVENTGDVGLEFIQVTATFYDSSHQVIATSFTFTTLNILLPGRKSPFEILLVDIGQAAQVDHYSLNTQHNVHGAVVPIGLEILSDSSYEDMIGYMHIVGEIKNIDDSPTTFVKVIATCYDGSGTVVTTGFTFSNPTDLDPDEVAPFEILLVYTDRVDLIVSYSLTAESDGCAIIPEFQVATILLAILGLIAIIVAFQKKLNKVHTH